MMKLELPEGLPLSSVLEDDVKQNNLGLQMEYLYNKFIKEDSLVTVNLPYGIRSTLTMFFEAERAHSSQPKESFLFDIMDESALNILDLMLDSFGRFTLTETYKQWEIEMDALHAPSTAPSPPTTPPPALRSAASLPRLQDQYGLK